MRVESAFKESNTWGARPSSMGGAFISVSDDANGIAYNPSGIAQAEQKQIMYMYSKPYTGIDNVYLTYGFLSFIYPFSKIGVFGIGWKNFNSLDLYQENAIIFSYGFNMNQLISDKMGSGILTGINLKYLFNNYKLDKRTDYDPVFSQGTGKGTVSIDAGIIIKKLISKLPELTVGIVMKNINQPDIGLKGENPVYREFGIGISYHLEKFLFMKYLSKITETGKIDQDKKQINRFIETFILSMDITYRNKEYNFKLGAEVSFWGKLLSIRTGGNLQEFCFGLGTEFPLKRYKISVDYSFGFPYYLKDSYGSHKISLLTKF